ncbi:hypothetical protein CRM73_00360 [Kocuria sp. CCUG 69068]|uniref:hypothetical protein n=1 Tax=Kocuria sp. CCUG 69068 TaxID=2043138 RepID=UPI001E550A74|nr:hypothetical protein [Kocuria sp. CCUG 69068]
MTITDKIIELVGYLDACVVVTGGYHLNINHYDSQPGHHIIRVQVFPESLEQAQDISDVLDLTFVQSDRFPHQYEATRDGVHFFFQLNRDDSEGNPPQVTAPEEDAA